MNVSSRPGNFRRAKTKAARAANVTTTTAVIVAMTMLFSTCRQNVGEARMSV